MKMINRKIAPKTSLPSNIDLLNVQEIELKNGLKVHSLNGCSEPVLNLSIMLKSGRYYQNKEMLSGFAMSLLKKGTKNMSANEISEKLDFYGATLYTQSGMYMASVSLNCLSEKLEFILPIVKDVLTECNFPDVELQLEKNRQIQTIEINEEKTNYLASLEFNKALFGAEHPCGYLPTKENINSIKREDLLEYYNSKIQLNDESYIVLSGKVDEKTIALIDEFLGSILITQKFEEQEIPFVLSKEKIINITKEDSVQSSIRIGKHFLDVNHKDYIDFSILNMILGGFFGSRLMKNIREEKGYTYGIYSYLSSFIGGSYFVIVTDVGSQYKEATINEISKEINRLKTELISDEELQMVKNYYKGSIMKSVDGALRYASIVNNAYSLGVKEPRINKKIKAIDDITAERLLNLANKYLDLDEMYQVVAG